MVDYLRRTWAEIDLDAITENFALLRGRLAPGCRTMAVVKADAYGHGDGPVALALEQAGADWFAVSNINEGISLRRQGIARPILILGYTPPELAGQLASQRLAQAVVGLDYARELSQGAVAAGVALVASVHGDPSGLLQRPLCRALLESGAFQTLVCLKGRSAPGELAWIQKVAPWGRGERGENACEAVGNGIDRAQRPVGGLAGGVPSETEGTPAA